MAMVNLAGKSRTEVGKQASKQVRREGFIPANLYGHGMKALSIQIGVRDLSDALHTKAGENVVINLKIEGVDLKESTCLIKELQHNPVTDKIDHVDFTVISLTEKIAVQVPVVIKNAAEAPGIKEGGILDVIHHEITVECLPTNIPEKFEISVKALNINEAIHLKDVQIPEGVTCKLDPEDVIVAIHAPKEEAPAEEAAAAAGTEPEVIEKGKKPAEGEEEAKKA